MFDSDLVERFSALLRVPRIQHGFACAGAFGGFDADRATDREKLRGAVSPLAEHLVRTQQTHSANVAIVSRSADGVALSVPRVRSNEPFDRGIDGLVTSESGVLCHAISADCPLLLLAVDDGSAVGVAHCGWRGVARGMVGEVIDRLCERGEVRPERLIAVVSPGAGGCCYEVGDDVIEALRDVGVAIDAVLRPYRKMGERTTQALDLKRAIVQLAQQRGIQSERLEVASACSICGGDRYHSYRRNGTAAGRMSAVIARAS